MAHKKKHTGPIPPHNQPQHDTDRQGKTPTGSDEIIKPGPSGQEQDPKRRLGDFSGKGEHPVQQPGGKNDANH
jgi:hypothetical protein